MSTLMQAFTQWSTRPADEKFNSLADLSAAVRAARGRCRTSAGHDLERCSVVVANDAPTFQSASGRLAAMTHNAFGQLCRVVGAPSAWLRQLPARLVAENLNHGLAAIASTDATEDEMAHNATLLLDIGDDPGMDSRTTVRQFCSAKYGRIWNSDVVARLERLVQHNPEWQPAPAAFDGSRGLYASDDDMFAFMVDNDRRIFDSLPGGGLGRGFFASNSEVGAGSFTLTTFLYEYVCGNHRVWGAKGVQEIRIPHLGRADDRAFGAMAVELRKYADATTADDVDRIESVRRYIFNGTKDEVLDTLFGLHVPGVTRKLLSASIDRAEEREDRYGNPRSLWAITGAMTELSQEANTASERTALDRAAGKLMEVAF